MIKNINHLNVGDKVELCNKKLKPFVIKAKTEDEIIITNTDFIVDEDKMFLSETVVLGSVVNIGKAKFNIGDTVILKSKNGKELKMFVSYSIGKDGLVLSLKKNSSNSIINWILKFLKNSF